MKNDTNKGATVPSEAEVAARVETLLAQMSLEEKIGQLTQVGGDFVRTGAEARGRHPEGRGRLGPVAERPEAVQCAAEDCCRRKPIEDPAALRSGCDPRLPHDLPRATGHGLVVGSFGC